MRATNINEIDKQVIYLDGFATMPICAEARDAMLGALIEPYNSSSPHIFGERAASIVDRATVQVGELISAAPPEITFTSGATESNNIAILGGARAYAELDPRRCKIIVSGIEHKAVLEPARALAREGFELQVLSVLPNGLVDLQQLASLADTRTAIVSVMAANNETGVIQPLEEASAIARSVGALVHSDLAQAYGKVPIADAGGWLDYASISSHKVYGPQGVGALYVGAGSIEPAPLGYGGGQQRGRRPGTLPVAAIAGFGAAAELASLRQLQDGGRLERLLRKMVEILQSRGLRASIFADQANRIPGAASIKIAGVDAEQLCATVSRKVCISTGSACNTGQLHGSHVLKAIGLTESDASSAFRVCIPRETSEDRVRHAAEIIADAALRQFRTGRSVQAC